MELDDLKKSWKTIDKKLQDKQLITDNELDRIMQQKLTNTNSYVRSILRNNLIISVLAFGVLIYFVWKSLENSFFLGEIYFWTIIVLAFVAIPWNVYTTRYLKDTRIYDMPLTVVIERINRYNFWMTIERVIGMIVLFFLALISIIHLKVWQVNGWFPYFVYGVWGIGFIAYLYFTNKLTFSKLKKIRKNLDELKEVNEEN